MREFRPIEPYMHQLADDKIEEIFAEVRLSDSLRIKKKKNKKKESLNDKLSFLWQVYQSKSKEKED